MPSAAAVFLLITAGNWTSALLYLGLGKTQEFLLGMEYAGAPTWPGGSSAVGESGDRPQEFWASCHFKTASLAWVAVTSISP